MFNKVHAIFGIVLAAFGALMIAGSAAAADVGIGQSKPGQLDLQTPVTQVGRQVMDLHHLMLVIITGITIFVLALLVIVILRYNNLANKTPARWTHNSLVEFVWTAAPVVILVIIAIPSVRLLQLQEDFDRVKPDLVIKATGNQWYWTYSYKGQELEYDGVMIGGGAATLTSDIKEELNDAGYPPEAWKLATDTAVVVPVNKTVLVEVTAADVIHAWAVPSFGVKADGVPGRINRTWFNAEKEGVYFGQCSELCGKDHSYMPITVKVVSQGEYDAWLACAKADGPDGCETPTMFDYMERMKRQLVAEKEGEKLAALSPEAR